MMSMTRAFPTRKIAVSAICIVALAVPTLAQQVGSIDLSHTTSQVELRRPPAIEGQSGAAGMHEYHSCQSGTTDGAVKTTLLSLDRTEYRAGDHPVFEVQVENVGTTSIRVPFSANLSDLQPADAGQKFAYSTLELVLWIEGTNWRANTGGGVTLYGSDSRPETMLSLEPGQWVRIIAKGTITLPEEVTRRALAGDSVSHANAHVLIYNNETLLTPTANATTSDGLCLTETNGPSVPLEVKLK